MVSRAAVGASMASEKDIGKLLANTFNFTFASELDLNGLLEGYRQKESSDLFQVTRKEYAADRDANTRGTVNPSIMNKPFWMFQVAGGCSAYTARTTFGDTEEPFEDSDGPVWCFFRRGATCTKLSDGRIVCIGGEHEDAYDPDFCIYNGRSFQRATNSKRSSEAFFETI